MGIMTEPSAFQVVLRDTNIWLYALFFLLIGLGLLSFKKNWGKTDHFVFIVLVLEIEP